MDYAYWKTLKLDQKSYFIGALEKFDVMMNHLISSASDVTAMKKTSDKLSTNLDFKKKGGACLEKFSNYVSKGGINPDFINVAVQKATYEISSIIEGQPRWMVRAALNQARADLIYSFELAGETLIEFTYGHPNV